MSVLGSFLATWSQARLTFGDGIPTPGTTFDNSPALQQLESGTRAAAPGSTWTGGAADAYAVSNAHQARTLARMAELDHCIGREIDHSAAVVTRGRQQLDAVRQWVVAAAGSVPDNAAGDQMLVPIVWKGCSDIAEVITASNGELATVAERVRALGTEYAALGGDQKKPDGEATPLGWWTEG
ncbi:ESX-1 secretion-associated protein EspE [Mycolicibacterium aurum]|uniref:ESX-1 secretion-associated protein EspE n=1 Tax=Mycolicibacterium aurum TaxID=1791 RepID=A0A448IZN8_MYCAU|nr:EspA/EspE family type VII secretion system effector [Mycolicibacterium aurum]VEG57890.1 ESX-1 secretion-associated protein EspE [Mycolicibacterium aurum]